MNTGDILWWLFLIVGALGLADVFPLWRWIFFQTLKTVFFLVYLPWIIKDVYCKGWRPVLDEWVWIFKHRD